MDNENQASVLSRYEQKERDVEKRIQANENELKLTRLDGDEKRRVIDELRGQVRQLTEHIEKLMATKETARVANEAEVTRLTREYNETRKEMTSAQQELDRWRQRAEQLEAQGEQHRRELHGYREMIAERDKKLEDKFGEMSQVREEFESEKRKLEGRLEATKATGVAIQDLATELQRAQAIIKQKEELNDRLVEENQSSLAKIDQLQEDIEGKVSFTFLCLHCFICVCILSLPVL